MFVIRLPNGNLMVPQTATGNDGRVLGDVYVEIGPQDADYARLAEQALTPEEAERRRDRWRQDDEALRRRFAIAAQQRPNLGLTEPAVSPRSPDAGNAPGCRPTGDGLRIHPEQC